MLIVFFFSLFIIIPSVFLWLSVLSIITIEGVFKSECHSHTTKLLFTEMSYLPFPSLTDWTTSFPWLSHWFIPSLLLKTTTTTKISSRYKGKRCLWNNTATQKYLQKDLPFFVKLVNDAVFIYLLAQKEI